jgi:hypothetical protein
MSVPENFEVVDGIAYYRPVGSVTFPESMVVVERGIFACHEINVKKILIDLTKLTGFESLNTLERYQVGERMAVVAKGVVIAFVMRPEMIDPSNFGALVAANRGARGHAFALETEALAWLREQEV